MSGAQNFLDQRRQRLAASDAPINGIAGIEVDPNDPTRLSVEFVHPLPGEADGRPAGPPLGPADLRIDGGDRIRGIAVRTAISAGRHLRLTTSTAGDFSTYTLAIAPHRAGFDPVLRAANFVFHPGCASGDCAGTAAAAPPWPAAAVDYLARDYASYRQLMLDRLATRAPDWSARNAADLGVTLVEWLAYVGDALSYRLDHVGTEYALATARLRPSAARHARLVGYRMHQGVGARVLAQVQLAPGVAEFALPAAGVAFLTQAAGAPAGVLPLAAAEAAVAAGAIAFEPLAPAQLRAAHEKIALHHWGNADAMLARGATSCDLRDPAGALQLAAGDLLVLVQNRDPTTGRAADADPDARQAVRLSAPPERLSDPLEQVVAADGSHQPLAVWRVHWSAADALTTEIHHGARAGAPMALALGNIVPASHGLLRRDATGAPLLEPLGTAPDLNDPELPPLPGLPDEPKGLRALDRPRPFRPRLAQPELSFAAPWEAGPAARLAQLDAAQAQAQIVLQSRSGLAQWHPVADLIGQPADAPVFVPEVDADGRTTLRFAEPHGDRPSPHGRTPAAGEEFFASYRVGHGPAGNIGADALRRIAASGAVAANVAGVRNPLPAAGGCRRETIAEVRARAPVHFHRQQRAVTLADYEQLLRAHPQVQRAVARQRWLGGWPAIFLTVDRVGGRPVDAEFRQQLRAYLEPYRMMGHDLAIDAPMLVPLVLAIHACAAPDAFADQVQSALQARFSAGHDEAGRPGFFHPDRLSFGGSLELSHIYAAGMDVAGVADLRVTEFRRAGGPDAVAAGRLQFGPREIPVLANDPNHPGEGRLRITTGGGR